MLHRAPAHERRRPGDRRAVRRPARDHAPRPRSRRRRWSRTSDGPFFTIDHFDGYNAVLVQQRRLGEIEPRRAGRGDHRRVAAVAPEVAGQEVPWRLSRDARATRPGWRRSRCCKAVRVDDAYTNLVLPAAAARARARAAATRRSPPSWRRARSAARARTTRSSPPASTGRWPRSQAKVLDALRLGHPPAARRCGCPAHAAISTTVDLVRSEVGPGPAGFANAVLRKVSAHDLDGWVRRVAPDPTADPVGYLPWPLPPALGGRGARRGASAGPASSTPCSPPTTSAPRVTLVARPGRVDRRRAARASRRRARRTACCSAGGDPGAVPAVAEGRAGVQDEGSQLVALALAAAAARRARRALARPVRRARAARPRCSPRWRPSAAPGCWPTSGSRTGRGLVRAGARAAPTGVLGVVAADGTRPPWADRLLRPGAGRRAVHRARRAAPPSRGALAAPARRTSPTWCRCSARCSTAALDLVRPGGVVLYATCSPVLAETVDVRRVVLRRARRREARGRGGRCCPEAVDPTAPVRCPAPSSSGRTGTAPTRCSWRCCESR